MTSGWALAAIALVCVTTSAIGLLGLRFTRGTSDFYVAGRTVTPWRNASAIGGEYLSAASFLGVAALMYDRGLDTLWLPVGYTVGYLVLLVLVAAPLRRSGAYTLPDFAELRLDSRIARTVCSVFVIGIGWLYLIPQLQGAGLVLRHVTGWPQSVGTVVVAALVAFNVALAGMRSITLVQAVQYWLKLTALVVPAFVMLAVWFRDGRPAAVADSTWWDPLTSTGNDGSLYGTYSVLLALCLGSMGLPHVVVRFYTNPTGREARRTTVAVLALLGAFYVWPPVYGWLGRVYLSPSAAGERDTMVLRLPESVVSTGVAQALGAMLAAGAFAAFLSTSSGLLMAVSGVLDQDIARPLQRRWRPSLQPSRSFRAAVLVATLVPFAVAVLGGTFGISLVVGYAFAIASTTFAPLLLLGVWWRGLSRKGALAGVLVGGLGTSISAAIMLARPDLVSGTVRQLLVDPAAWATPLAVFVMVVVSLMTPGSIPASTARTLTRLHVPEAVALGDPNADPRADSEREGHAAGH